MYLGHSGRIQRTQLQPSAARGIRMERGGSGGGIDRARAVRCGGGL